MNGPILVHYVLLLAALICCFCGFLRRWEAGPPGLLFGWLGVCFYLLDLLLFTANHG